MISVLLFRNNYESKRRYNQYLKKMAAGKPGEPTEKTLKRKGERENELLEHGNEGKAQNFVLK